MGTHTGCYRPVSSGVGIARRELSAGAVALGGPGRQDMSQTLAPPELMLSANVLHLDCLSGVNEEKKREEREKRNGIRAGRRGF